MPVYNLTCEYCGHEWKKSIWVAERLYETCPVCQDKNVKGKPEDYEKIDFYQEYKTAKNKKYSVD